MHCVILPPPLLKTVQYRMATTGKKMAKSMELNSIYYYCLKKFSTLYVGKDKTIFQYKKLFKIFS